MQYVVCGMWPRCSTGGTGPRPAWCIPLLHAACAGHAPRPRPPSAAQARRATQRASFTPAAAAKGHGRSSAVHKRNTTRAHACVHEQAHHAGELERARPVHALGALHEQLAEEVAEAVEQAARDGLGHHLHAKPCHAPHRPAGQGRASVEQLRSKEPFLACVYQRLCGKCADAGPQVKSVSVRMQGAGLVVDGARPACGVRSWPHRHA